MHFIQASATSSICQEAFDSLAILRQGCKVPSRFAKRRASLLSCATIQQRRVSTSVAFSQSVFQHRSSSAIHSITLPHDTLRPCIGPFKPPDSFCERPFVEETQSLPFPSIKPHGGLSGPRVGTIPNNRRSKLRSEDFFSHSEQAGKEPVFHTVMPPSPPPPPKDPELGKLPPISDSNAPDPLSAQPNEIAWGPAHPCYPHPNPHVPLSSLLHNTTRIIRIKRDWMTVGDLAPTFSNIYPEILEPWVSESDFRSLIQHVNEGLIAAFRPGGWRAWMDAVLGVATGWIWEDLGMTGVKSGVQNVERWIEEWNGRDSKSDDDGKSEGAKVIPLRRTGYLSLDIQIPDPHVGLIETRPNSANG